MKVYDLYIDSSDQTLYIAVWDGTNTTGEVRAYNPDTGARITSKDLTLDSGNTEPVGVWANSSTFYVGGP